MRARSSLDSGSGSTNMDFNLLSKCRFEKVAEMFDISKLNIRIKTKTQFLSPGVNYGAYLIFKFCDSRKYSSKSRYVNLKYKKGGENLHAYFARWRDDEWMMIELYRFLCEKKDTKFEVLLESFSRYYCGKSSIYVEGIQFRVIDNVSLKILLIKLSIYILPLMLYNIGGVNYICYIFFLCLISHICKIVYYHQSSNVSIVLTVIIFKR